MDTKPSTTIPMPEIAFQKQKAQITAGDSELHHYLFELEKAARVCYKSEGKIKPGSAERLLEKCIERGHESVLEHKSITMYIETNRAIANEIVRHRLASYSQESTRYVRYLGKFHFIYPTELFGFGANRGVAKDKERSLPRTREDAINMFEGQCRFAAQGYTEMLNFGYPPEVARDLLPLALRTSLYMTANIREWRHIFKLRLNPAAHPQIRELFFPPFTKLLSTPLGCLFGDIIEKGHVDPDLWDFAERG